MPKRTELPPALISEFDGVRSLHLGTVWVQGSMRLREPRHVELEYVQRMLAALLWLPEASLGRGHAVQLGLGAGALTRFCLRVLHMRCTVVELNPAVIQICRRHFHLPVDSARLQVLNEDAGDWVGRAEHIDSVQLLQVDLYDHEAAAPVLDDERFYAGCRAVLSDGGVMSVNLFGRNASFARSHALICGVFGAGQVCSLRATREGNTVLLAGKGVRLPDRATLVQRAANIESRYGAFGAPARKWLRMLRATPAVTEAEPT
jgi:spermidine synthase